VRPARLAGLRVLVVEDEMLVSMMIEDALADERCVVVGPFNRVPGALEAARNEALDLAILDVNVAGVQVYPVADVLHARKIPFLFLSGYGRTAIPLEHPDWQVCAKPFHQEDLIGMLVGQLERAAAAGRQA
jgi:CheY-like chemotaxis protein